MQRIGRDQAAFQRGGGQLAEQGLEGWNLVALFLDRLLRHRQPQAVAHRREQLQRLAIGASAAAQTFAIHGQALENGNFLGHHPLADAQVKFGGVQAVEHPKESAVAGGAVTAGFRVQATAQCPQLSLRELVALIFKGFIATSAHEHGDSSAGQHKGLQVP